MPATPRKPVIIDPSSTMRVPPAARILADDSFIRRPNNPTSGTRDYNVRVPSALLPSPPRFESPVPGESPSSISSSNIVVLPRISVPQPAASAHQSGSGKIASSQHDQSRGGQDEPIDTQRLRNALETVEQSAEPAPLRVSKIGIATSSFERTRGSLTTSEADMLGSAMTEGIPESISEDAVQKDGHHRSARESGVFGNTIKHAERTDNGNSGVNETGSASPGRRESSELQPHSRESWEQGIPAFLSNFQQSASARPFAPTPIFSEVVQTAIRPAINIPKVFDLSDSTSHEQYHVDGVHYEGCILCTPQVSPRSSGLVSEDEVFFAPSHQHSGPPPDIPLPQTDKLMSGKSTLRRTSTEFNPLVPFLEGEVQDQGQTNSKNTIPRIQEPHNFNGSSNHCNLRESNEEFSQQFGRIRPQSGRESVASRGAASTRSELNLLSHATAPAGSQNFGSLSPIVEQTKRDSWVSNLTFQIRNAGAASRQINSARDDNDKRLPISGRKPTPGAMGSNNMPGQFDHHPGDHRVGPQLDGVYEMVDLGGVTTPTPAPIETGRKRKYSNGSRSFWILILVLVIFASSLVILTGIYAVWPSVAQTAVKSTDLSVTSLSITELTPATLMMSIGMTIKSKAIVGGKVTSNLLVLSTDIKKNLKLLDKNSQNEKKTVKRDYPLLSRTEAIGLVSFPDVEVHKKAQVTLEGRNRSGKKGSSLEVLNKDTLDSLFSGVIFGSNGTKSGVEMNLSGDLMIKSGGLTAKAKIDRTIILPSMGGFSGLVVNKYWFEKSNDTSTDGVALRGELGWSNPTESTINLGDLGLNVSFGGLLLGKGSIDGLSMKPGGNNFSFVAGVPLSKNSSRFPGEFLTSIIARAYGNSEGYTGLHIQGTNMTQKGVELPYLLGTAEKFNFDLISAVGLGNNICTNFDMNLALRLAQPSISQGLIGIDVSLPFSTIGFPFSVIGAGYQLSLKTVDGDTFAKSNVDIESSNTTSSGMVPRENVQTSFGNRTLDILKEDVWNKKIVYELIRSDSVTVKVEGHMSAKVRSEMGESVVNALEFDGSYTMTGLNGLTKGGKEKLEIIDPIMLDGWNSSSVTGMGGLEMEASIVLDFPNDAGLDLGSLNFGLQHKDQILGNLSIPHFSVKRGRNLIPVKMRFDLDEERTPHMTALMDAVLIGGIYNITLFGHDATSNSTGIRDALAGEIMATISVSKPTELFENTYFIFNDYADSENNTIDAAFTLSNPWIADLSVTFVDMTFTNVKDSFVVASINQKPLVKKAVPGLSDDRKTRHMGLLPRVVVVDHTNPNNIKELIGNGLIVDVYSRIEIVIGSFKIFLQYSQGKMPVLMGREDTGAGAFGRA